MNEVSKAYMYLVSDVYKMPVELGSKALDNFLETYPNHEDQGVRKIAIEDLRGELYLNNSREEMALSHYRSILSSLDMSDGFYPIILLRYIKILSLFGQSEDGLSLIESYFEIIVKANWLYSLSLLKWYAENCDTINPKSVSLLESEVEFISTELGFPVSGRNIVNDINQLSLESTMASKRFSAFILTKHESKEAKREALLKYLQEEHIGFYQAKARNALLALDNK